MKEIAKVKIQETFKITYRGLVMVINILEGTFNRNDVIAFHFERNKITRKILSFSMGSRNRQEYFIGLNIECKNDEELEELRNWKPNKTIASIYSTTENE